MILMVRLTKICPRCWKEKEFEEFRNFAAAPHLRKSFCRSCDDEYQKERYQRQKDKMKANAVKWRTKNPAKFKAIRAAYYRRKKAKETKEKGGAV